MDCVNTMRRLTLILIVIFVLAGCNGESASEDIPPTDTLAPIVSLTPRLTATPFASLTPLPTRTFTPTITPVPPTATDTLVPTATPPITGSINSVNTVNVREGPGTTFSAFIALDAGTRVTVLGQNEDGSWYEVELEDGDRGWISAPLVRLQPTNTPIPTFTPSPDFTALAQGTPLPTAVLGGGTVTPTPPNSLVTPTLPGTAVAETDGTGEVSATATRPLLPVRDVTALYQTATALAGGISIITPRPNPQATASPTGQSPNVPAPTQSANVTVTSQATTSASTGGNTGNAQVVDGVDVFALCNNRAFGISAPNNLAAGSTIDVYWAWYMSAPDLIDQHLNAVSYEIRINDELLEWRQFGIGTRQEGSSWVKYWFVPYGPLQAGDYLITYRATWSEAISDGFEQFGPGTRNPVEEGSCTFTVR